MEHIQSQSIAFAYEGGNGLATEDTPLDYESSGDRKITVDGVDGLEKETARIKIMSFCVMVYYMVQVLGMVKTA